MRQSLREYCFAQGREDLLLEWHPTKNETITPDTIGHASAKRVWWRCKNGHEWQARLGNRTAFHYGCPHCSNTSPPPEKTLSSRYPDIAAQWHPTKNGDLSPHSVFPFSKRHIWWQCELGHEWQAAPNDRTSDHTGCPFCSGRRTLSGFNDLKTRLPDLAAQWHPTLNGEFTPDSITCNSTKLVWWICEKGHEWQASPNNRVGNHTGCPYCSGRKALPGINDLATTHPALAAQWHPTLNAPLEPTMVSAGSNKSVWWICEKGHEWQTQPNTRTQRSSGCPICSGRKVLPGFNDLATTYPDIAAQWHPTKNAPLEPTMVSAGSNKRVWWICEKGHEWLVRPNNRTGGHSGCPICAHKRTLNE